MTLGSLKHMHSGSPPDDLVTISQGAQQTRLTWAQINHAVNKAYLRSWKLGLRDVRYVSLAELRVYEQRIVTLRPAWEASSEEPEDGETTSGEE